MNIRVKNFSSNLAGLILGISMLFMSGFAFAQDYEGAEFCKTCHEANYNDWTASGHPYKLMKGEDAKHRPIPLPNGFNWPEDGVLVEGDVSYVIGGYKWKSRYMDHQGYIITTTCEPLEPFDTGCTPVAVEDTANQYNYMTGKWVSYHPEDDNGTRPYTCGSCHTTNWVPDLDADTDDDLTDNQDGLPGIWGTFDDGGVHCEQCHGNGMASMNIDTSAEACGICHFRDAAPGAEVNVVSASGGFIKHHEQYNEFLAGPHAGQTCVTCHDPHKRGEFSIKEGGQCETCHGAIALTYADEPMAGYGVECKDCHMPYATKSGNQLGPFEGDLQTHIFYINTDADGEMFTEDGSAVALDFPVEGKTDKAAVTLDFACLRCHETAELTELSKFAKNFHGTEEGVSELEYVGINPGLSATWWGGIDYNGEGFVIEVAYDSANVLTLVGSFYTYDSAGAPEWLFATGTAESGMTSDVTIFISDGQRTWGSSTNPTNPPTVEWGTGSFTFTSCTSGTFTFTPNATYADLGFTEISYDLERNIEPGVACPTLNSEAP
jgi:hypothetical protein